MNVNIKQYKDLGGNEKNLQNYCLERLRALENQGKCYYFRNNSFAGRITRYNGSQGFVNNAKRGMPDIVCCFQNYHTYWNDITNTQGKTYFGQFVGLEIKGPDGRQSSEQKQAQDTIQRAGGMYEIVRSPEQFEILIKQFI